MDNRLFLWAICMAVLLAGCSPRVVSEMFSDDYAPVSPDSVKVFPLGEKVPPHSLAIGKVKVVDNGFSSKGDYPQVLRLAVEETAKHGGNGLVIEEHRMPDMVSTIHRVWGTMLRMDQTVSDSVAGASFDLALRSDEPYQEYQEAKQRAEELQKNLPRRVVKVNFGPSWLTSKYETERYVYNSRFGTGYDVEVDFLWKSGFGVGLLYGHTRTAFKEDIKMYTDFVAPGLVFAYMIGEKWRMDGGIMIGYSSYSETWKGYKMSESHAGLLMQVGMEYMLSPNVGLGLQTNVFSMRLDKPEGLKLEKNEFYGIRRLGLEAGLRFYF